MIKNTNIGTVTDGSGNYQLTVTQTDPNLVFSFIGFASTEVAAGDKTQVNVQLSEDVSQLSEIVVVGYGAEKTDDAPETLELANPYGGRRAYKQYLEKNMQYPEQALAQNIEGKVTIQFTVESSGQLSDFRVIKGIGHGCDEEVMRLVKQGPKWNPTRRNTESLRDKVKVRMKFTLPKK
jgi:TonB family protein